MTVPAPALPSASSSAGTPAPVKPFSQSTALIFVDGSMELLREVADAALTETPGLTARLSTAVRAADARETKEAAHSLKGMLQCLGALPAAACARDLEQMGRSGDIARAPAVLVALEREIEKFLGALRAAMA
jgi:HPt (histidine-containing phosphotransfer) domain-containing protein